MKINELNELDKKGILKDLYKMGVIKPEIFTYIEMYNKYNSLGGLIKKKSHKVRVLRMYFKYSTRQIYKIISLFDR